MRKWITFIIILLTMLFWTFILTDEIDDLVERKFNKNHWRKGFWLGFVQIITWYFSILIATIGTYYILSSDIPYLIKLGETI